MINLTLYIVRVTVYDEGDGAGSHRFVVAADDALSAFRCVENDWLKEKDIKKVVLDECRFLGETIEYVEGYDAD